MRLLKAPAAEVAPTPNVLDASVPAPRIADILADSAELGSRAAYPFYALRSSCLDGDPTTDPQFRIVATTEAKAIQDFGDKMQVAAGILRTRGTPLKEAPFWAERADHLRQELRFIGGKELEVASAAIAQHWLNKLNASQAGELFVALENNSSPLFVYTAVMRALEQLEPAAAPCVTPLDWRYIWDSDQDDLDTRSKKAGMVILDDWSISGSQIQERVDNLIASGIPWQALDINLVAANKEHVQRSFGGVPCKAYFSYTPFYRDDGGFKTTLTGAHGDTDYGFGYAVNGVYKSLATVGRFALGGDASLGKPLLSTIARSYRRQTRPLDMPAEAAALFTERQERCRAVAAAMFKPHPEAEV